MDGSYVLPSSSRSHQRTSSFTAPAPLDVDSPPPEPAALSTPKPKRSIILDAANAGELNELRRLAASPGGFISDDLRRVVWPILLGCKTEKKPVLKRVPLPNGSSIEHQEEDGELVANGLPPHKDEQQVRLDVIRSFINYPTNISEDEKEALRVDLEDVTVTVLRRYPALSYFQGYHDIISVLQLTLDDQELSIAAAERMSLHRIRDSLGPGLEPVLGYLKLVHRILEKVDPDLSYIVSLAASLPYFSLSWVLTLLSHDVTSIAVIARLFDFLLAYNPAMVSYIGVAIILLKKEELASLDEDSIEDPAMLHHTLSKLPEIILDPSTSDSEDFTDEDDEDLASTVDGSRDSIVSHSPTLSSSYLSDSIVSFGSSTGSLDAFDDSMLSDPDITGLAFDDPPSPPPRSEPSTPTSQSAPWNLPVSLEDIITRALELYEDFPLVGEGGIAADEVMGPKSCVFTWELSTEGRLSDKAAEDIVRDGVDIIVPEFVEEAASEKEEEEAKELDTSIPAVSKRKRRTRRTSRKVEVGIGTALIVVGVGVALVSIYGVEAKAFRERWIGRWPW